MPTNNAIDLSDQGVPYYDGAGTFSGLDGVTANFVLTSNGPGVAPSFQSVTTLLPWITEVVSFNALSNHGYFIGGAATVTLPASPSQGDTVKIIVATTDPVVVQANTGQIIGRSAALSSTAGTFTNSQRGDSLDLYFISAATAWADLGSNGAWTPT